MTSAIFIIILLIVSGFVAWAGDVLGSLLGKKRIALFGLRPRRTSLLIAILTGILITALTIGGLTLMSQRFRQMMFEFDKKLAEITSLTNERDEIKAERDRAQSEREQALAQLQTDKEKYLAALDEIQGSLSTVETEYLNVQGKVEGLTSDKTDLERQVAQKESDLSALVARTAQLNNEVQSMTSERNSLNVEISSLATQISNLRQEISTLNAQVTSFESGTVKVYEGQQLIVIPIDTNLDGTTIYEIMRGAVNRIPETYQDPDTGDYVLSKNKIGIQIEAYSTALEQIRALVTDSAVVIVYATENVVEDMDVPVRLEVKNNFMVYSSGSVIYSEVYEDLKGAIDPYRAVLARFFENAKDYIVEGGGIIPYTSGEALQMPIDTLIELADELESVGLPAEIKIVALKDIYSTDFLLYGEQFKVLITPVDSEGTE